MKKLLFVLTLSVMCYANASHAQGTFETQTDPVTGGELYRGDVTFDDLSHFAWQSEGYKNYQPDPAAIAILQQSLNQYQLIVFLGTWCEDSHLLMPQLEKILHQAGFAPDAVQLVAVDRNKTSPSGLEKEYDVQFVPTILVIQEGAVKGRIVENAYPSLEKMLADIVQKED